jgi:hypothetical protein
VLGLAAGLGTYSVRWPLRISSSPCRASWAKEAVAAQDLVLESEPALPGSLRRARIRPVTVGPNQDDILNGPRARSWCEAALLRWPLR